MNLFIYIPESLIGESIILDIIAGSPLLSVQ